MSIIPSKSPSVLLGDYISLNCSSSDFFRADAYIWVHEGNSITLAEGADASILTLPRISAEQLGTYRCMVFNSFFDTTAEVTLTSASEFIASQPEVRWCVWLVITPMLHLFFRASDNCWELPTDNGGRFLPLCSVT